MHPIRHTPYRPTGAPVPPSSLPAEEKERWSSEVPRPLDIGLTEFDENDPACFLGLTTKATIAVIQGRISLQQGRFLLSAASAGVRMRRDANRHRWEHERGDHAKVLDSGDDDK
jgi:hypothetical protein